jgi:hypothetical protein
LGLKSKVEATDIFIFTGLILIGIGLFLFQGLGVALLVVGALLFGMGFFGGAIRK